MKIENMTPRRKARERKFWRKVFFVSLVPVAVFVYLAWYWAFLASLVVSFFIYVIYEAFAPDDDYGWPMPWWFYGL